LTAKIAAAAVVTDAADGKVVAIVVSEAVTATVVAPTDGKVFTSAVANTVSA
jgi:hypothetical protein